jgi:transposase
MHDNARPHVVQVVSRYLHDIGINTVDWPARSPDLNPIEHLWDHMERQVAASQPAPINLNDLGNRLVEIWDGVDQDYIRHLTPSRDRRCQAVVTTRGGNTCY